MQTDTLAPDFSLPDQNGKQHSLSGSLGKWVFLYFYPQDETPGCVKEACTIRDEWDQFTKLDVVVYGISPDSVESHQKFAEHHTLPFTILADPDKYVLKEYDAWTEKSAFGVTVGTVRRSSVLINPEGKIVRWYPQVHPDTHIAEVLADIRELKE